MKKKSLLLLLSVMLIGCGAMAVVDGILRPGYLVKSAIKIGFFAFVMPVSVFIVISPNSLI